MLHDQQRGHPVLAAPPAEGAVEVDLGHVRLGASYPPVRRVAQAPGRAARAPASEWEMRGLLLIPLRLRRGARAPHLLRPPSLLNLTLITLGWAAGTG